MRVPPSQIAVLVFGLLSALPVLGGDKVQDFLKLPDSDVEAMKITKRQLNSILRGSSKSAVVETVKEIDYNGPDLFSSNDLGDSGIVSAKTTKCVLAQMAELKDFDAKKEYSQRPALRYHLTVAEVEVGPEEEHFDASVSVGASDVFLKIYVQADGVCSFVPVGAIRRKLNVMYAEQARQKSVEERVPANENLLLDAVHETSFRPGENDPVVVPADSHGEI